MSRHETHDAVEVITAKRDRGELSDSQIDWVVDAYTRGAVADEQMSALAMAIAFVGLEPDELQRWTDAMIASGERLPWPWPSPSSGSSPRPDSRQQLVGHRAPGVGVDHPVHLRVTQPCTAPLAVDQVDHLVRLVPVLGPLDLAATARSGHTGEYAASGG
jgi:hypothetical protein